MSNKVPDIKEKKTLAEQLAAFVVRMRYEDISEDARQQLKIHILDSIGCAIGALAAPPGKALHAQLDEFGGKPLTSLIGGGKKKHLPYIGAMTGLAAGVGALILTKPMGLSDAPVTRTDKTKVLTVAWYTFGGIVAGSVMKALRK